MKAARILCRRHFSNVLATITPYKRPMDDHKFFHMSGENNSNRMLMTTYYAITNNGVKTVDMREQRDSWYVDSNKLYVVYHVVDPNKAVINNVDTIYTAVAFLKKEVAKCIINPKLQEDLIDRIETNYGLLITEMFFG
jgi:hypothetical protein